MDDVDGNDATEHAPASSMPQVGSLASSVSDEQWQREYQAAYEQPASPQPLAVELQPGTLLGERYTIVRKLGQGGMGVVYEAMNANIEHIRYAIKTLLPNKPKADTEHFLQEAKRASRVRSPHVVRISDFGTDIASGLTYMVMDYVGSDLETYIRARGGTLPPAQAVDFTVQVCEALAAAHAEKVVHRDIKPLNCLLRVEDGREVVVVTDFGIARDIRVRAPEDDGTRTETLWTAIGTQGYVAPEVMLREARADHRVDIYGVGAMLFRMVIGRTPPLAPTVDELRESGVPASLRTVLATALARAPRDRYPTAKAFQTALREVLPQAAIPDRPHEPRPKRLARLVPALVLSVVLAGLTFAWWPRDPPLLVSIPPDEPSPPTPTTVTGPLVTLPDEPPEATADDRGTPSNGADAGNETGTADDPDPVASQGSGTKSKPPTFAQKKSAHESIVRDFCKTAAGVLRCTDKLELKAAGRYKDDKLMTTLSFTFSPNKRSPKLASSDPRLNLEIEEKFRRCVELRLQKLKFVATSDGGELSCSVAL